MGKPFRNEETRNNRNNRTKGILSEVSALVNNKLLSIFVFSVCFDPDAPFFCCAYIWRFQAEILIAQNYLENTLFNCISYAIKKSNMGSNSSANFGR